MSIVRALAGVVLLLLVSASSYFFGFHSGVTAGVAIESIAHGALATKELEAIRRQDPDSAILPLEATIDGSLVLEHELYERSPLTLLAARNLGYLDETSVKRFLTAIKAYRKSNRSPFAESTPSD